MAVHPEDERYKDLVGKMLILPIVNREIPVVMRQREAGASSIHGFRSAYYMIKVSLSILICRITFGIRR